VVHVKQIDNKTVSEYKILITDTSVLINFLNINRIDMLNLYPGLFYITEHVIEEITIDFPDQKLRLTQAIYLNIFTVVSVDSEEEIILYNELLKERRLGPGECSAIACAINRKYSLVIDDVRARKQAIQKCAQLEIINTKDIIVWLIQMNHLTIAEADFIKNIWETEFRFAFKFKSFAEVL
jgi:predicted nucleic acid-binding protein